MPGYNSQRQSTARTSQIIFDCYVRNFFIVMYVPIFVFCVCVCVCVNVCCTAATGRQPNCNNFLLIYKFYKHSRPMTKLPFWERMPDLREGYAYGITVLRLKTSKTFD
jgi:hypothetical protein